MTTNRPSANSASATLITMAVVVAVLYFAREVFIPVALAILFSFLLAPLVIRLRHWGLPRVPAVVLVVVSAFGVIAVLGALVAAQLGDLGNKMPEYQSNIRAKLQTVRDSGNGAIRRVTRVINDFTRELNPPPPASPRPADGTQPVPVEIQREAFSPLEMGRTVLGPVLNIVLLGVIVVVFVIFMLLQHEDLRDRFIRLVGSRQLNVTTKALDDAAHRVSRFLVAQLAVNIAFAVPASFGLYLMGVPNPLLWGLIAAVLRYIPYLGMWLATLAPAAVAFAIDPGWVKPLLVVALYFGIDVFMYNFVEPWLYGSSTGTTPLAILFAAVFWTWLWGPVGLLLSTPLTVCLAVLGRHVPSLRFLGILLSDEPMLPAEKRFYQRLLAADMEEAMDVAEEFLKGKSLEELFECVMVPALILVEEDRHAGKLDEQQQQFIFRSMRTIVEEIAKRAPEVVAGETNAKVRAAAEARGQEGGLLPEEIAVLSLPANDEADEVVALMLAQLLNARGIGTKPISAAALASERLEDVERERVRVVAVVAVPPSGYMHARYLCKRLRAQLPEVRIVAAILGSGEVAEIRKREPSVPANEIAASLAQAVADIVSFVSAPTARPVQPVLSS